MMFIDIDRTTGDWQLNLPQSLTEHKHAAFNAVMDEFAFEAVNQQVLLRMNEYLRSWFAQKGITLPETPEEKVSAEEEDRS